MARLACWWEATARKPGNVHPQRSFADLTYQDLVASAAAIGPVLDQAVMRTVGETVLEGVKATRRVVQTNTNLGQLLLLAPLAAVPAVEHDLRSGLARILERLDRADARAVYEAIRLANPGGLGRVADQDVQEPPTRPLREIMALAADRDLIARQYANHFHEVFAEGLPALVKGLQSFEFLEDAIIGTHLELLARHPDSLIARKRGPQEATQARRRARQVLDAGWPRTEAGRKAVADLDAWLRGDGHARNPGTTADLVTASLFAALRQGIITVPSAVPWSRDQHHAPTL